MPRRRNEVIFEAVVEYRDNRRISAFQEDRRIEDTAIRVLTVDLPRDLDQLFGVDVSVEIKGSRYGSLSIFFGVALTAYSVLSGYKGIFDSVRLIREQSDRLLASALADIGPMTTQVYVRYPQVDESPSDLGWLRRIGRHFQGPMDILIATPPPDIPAVRRDAFFFFLLALCIIEACAIALLVYAAVAKTYFP